MHQDKRVSRTAIRKVEIMHYSRRYKRWDKGYGNMRDGRSMIQCENVTEEAMSGEVGLTEVRWGRVGPRSLAAGRALSSLCVRS